MIGRLFELGLSNAAFAAALCVLAFLVDRKFRQPRVTHIILLFAFVKLLTPPLFSIPIDLAPSSSQDEPVTERRVSPLHEAVGLVESGPSPVVAESEPLFPWPEIRILLTVIWIGGTVLMVAVALVRVWTFHRLLRQTTRPGGDALQSAAERVSLAMELRSTPTMLMTSACLSPFVWWAGREVIVVVPERLMNSIPIERCELLLAHEFAHVRRRDYLVRWLECAVCALFWWNPTVWWAQAKLRFTEEACCDEFVVRQLGVGSREYASTLIDALESLVCPAIRPPAIVSAINSGGVLERRIQMILSGEMRTFSRSLYGLVCAIAFTVIPLGVVEAQDFDAVKRRLARAVENDEITFDQAALMMNALLESHRHEHHAHTRDELIEERDSEQKGDHHDHLEMHGQSHRQIHKEHLGNAMELLRDFEGFVDFAQEIQDDIGPKRTTENQLGEMGRFLKWLDSDGNPGRETREQDVLIDLIRTFHSEGRDYTKQEIEASLEKNMRRQRTLDQLIMEERRRASRNALREHVGVENEPDPEEDGADQEEDDTEHKAAGDDDEEDGEHRRILESVDRRQDD